MEDAHTTVLDLDDTPEKSNAFFAVYDGHGGVYSVTIMPFSATYAIS